MDTTTNENDSESGPKAPEKWLEKVAALQADNRELRAQLSVARGLIAATNKEAIKWDSDGQPCWCQASDGGGEFATAHSIACFQLRRLLRGLMLELISGEVLP